MMWIQRCQRTTYYVEIANIESKNQCLPLVRQLTLFLDVVGYVEAGYTTHHFKNLPDSYTSYRQDIRWPAWLSPTLIVQSGGSTYAGATSVITHFRQKHWIPSVRQCIQSVIRKCVTCRTISGRPYAAPGPPPLTNYRVEDTKLLLYLCRLYWGSVRTWRQREWTESTRFVYLDWSLH